MRALSSIPAMGNPITQKGAYPVSKKVLLAGTGVVLTPDDAAQTITIDAGVAASRATWGSISGTLSSQADLQTALNGKAAVATTLAGYGITDAAPLSHVGSGGSAHALVVALGAAGFMSGSDKSKLDGVAAGATANSSDAFLLSRANHTGTQAATTITGLAALATSGSASDLVTGIISAARMPAFAGDVTSPAGSLTLSIGAHKVTRGMLSATVGAVILGTTAAGDVTDLTGTQAKAVLAITAADVSGLATVATSGSAADLSAGTLAAARMPALTGDVTTAAGAVATTIAAGSVTLAKMANMATGSLIYRKTAGTGVPEVQTLATLKSDLGLTGTNSGDQTITLTGDVTGSGTGSFATAIGANKVTRAMLAAASGAVFLGAAAAGNVSDLSAAQATALLNAFSSTLKGLVPASGGGTVNFMRADGTWADPIDETAWTTFTPTVTAGSGTFTTLGAVTGRYKKIGKTLFLSYQLAITTNGTASGSIIASLPPGLANATSVAQLAGREAGVTGKALQTFDTDGLHVGIQFYDGTYPGANGALLRLSGVIEVQ